jgi:hypothetical protein
MLLRIFLISLGIQKYARAQVVSEIKNNETRLNIAIGQWSKCCLINFNCYIY